MLNTENILNEIEFKAVRSSGAGGQHVNKVATRVELTFNLLESKALSQWQKNRLLKKLQPRLTKQGVLILQCGETRSQHKNKALVTNRFFELLEQNLKVSKPRIPTKIPRSVIKKRLKNKKHHSNKKANRGKPNLE